MLDHVLLDVIAEMREAFEESLLEPLAIEERFQVDVFLGDLSFSTSYSLPGEDRPPRLRADIGLDWPTWSQSAYRSWSIGEPPPEPPELAVEVALRVQRLATTPAVGSVLEALASLTAGGGRLELSHSGTTTETYYEPGATQAPAAVEISYQGTIRLDEEVLESPERLTGELAGLARFVASSLVRLGDLGLMFLPRSEEDPER
jgi:hypothetical protein